MLVQPTDKILHSSTSRDLQKKVSLKVRNISKQMQKVVNPSKLDLADYKIPKERIFQIENVQSEGRQALESLPTVGDGSCGLHALFGKYDPKTRQVRLDNVVQKRKAIANWVQRRFDQNTIPPLIKKAMIDYISYPSSAPQSIKNLISRNEDIQILLACINSLGVNEDQRRNELYNEIVNHPSMQKAYIDHLKERSSYLSDQELGAMAIKSGKKVNFYTIENGSAVLNATYGKGNNVVDIRFLPGHYERALISTEIVPAQTENKKTTIKQRAPFLNRIMDLFKKKSEGSTKSTIKQEHSDGKLALQPIRKPSESTQSVKKNAVSQEHSDRKLALQPHRKPSESTQSAKKIAVSQEKSDRTLALQPSRKPSESTQSAKKIGISQKEKDPKMAFHPNKRPNENSTASIKQRAPRTRQKQLTMTRTMQEKKDFEYARKLQEQEDLAFAKRLQARW